MQSTTIPLPSDLRWRRLFGLALFLGLLWLFRNLAPVFLCFVAFVRPFNAIAKFLDERTGLSERGATWATLAGFLASAMLGAWAIWASLVPRLDSARAEVYAVADLVLRHPLFEAAQKELAGQNLAGVVRTHALEAVHYATATLHVAIYIGIGLLLALMYLVERREIDAWFGGLGRYTIGGTLARWFGYVGDAVAVTLRLQVIVALFNAFLTLPVVLVLGLPHPFVLFVLMLVAGLLPVVGSFISGAVLCVIAYSVKGPWAVAVFLGITFVIAKVEGYVLTPRLAAQHVKLPSLLLVLNLLLFEQAFGFVGLFLSFPALYVATRIRNEWLEEPVAPAAVKPETRNVTPDTASPPTMELELPPEDAPLVPSLDGQALADRQAAIEAMALEAAAKQAAAFAARNKR
jgi:predicted PurR-regulated permease PerM